MSIQPSGGLTARPRELQPRSRPSGSAEGGASATQDRVEIGLERKQRVESSGDLSMQYPEVTLGATKLQQLSSRNLDLRPSKAGPPSPPPQNPQDGLDRGQQLPPISLKSYIQAGALEGAVSGRSVGEGVGSCSLMVVGAWAGGIGAATLATPTLMPHLAQILTDGTVMTNLANLGTVNTVVFGGAGASLGALGAGVVGGGIGGAIGAAVGKAVGSVTGLARGVQDKIMGRRPDPVQLDLPLAASTPQPLTPDPLLRLMGKFASVGFTSASAVSGALGGAALLATAGPVAMCAGGAAGAAILVTGFHKAKSLLWEGVSKTIRDVRAQNQQAWVAFNVKQASKKLQEAEAQLERLKQP